MTQVISVICPPDQHLHLAPYQHGLGTSVFTLCLQKWTDREPCREGSTICPQCLTKWQRSYAKVLQLVKE